ncbi:MAG: CvpA family protein [Defluviitaleaceae bacterium]|nr:CvpA family protein [Defluviitaleaceae bacterium]
MNYLDIIVLVLVAICAFAGYQQGLIRTVYRVASFFIAIALAYFLYPHAARLLRGTQLFYTIQDGIKSALNLDGVVPANGGAVIDSLPFPENMRDMLNTQFEPDIHGILGIDTMEEYISAFFANIAINGIALISVFALVLIGLAIVGVVLDIVGSLPVISTFNNMGGLLVGIVMGVGVSLLCVVALSLVFATGANSELYDLMQGSFFARNALTLVLPQLTTVT